MQQTKKQTKKTCSQNHHPKKKCSPFTGSGIARSPPW